MAPADVGEIAGMCSCLGGNTPASPSDHPKQIVV